MLATIPGFPSGRCCYKNRSSSQRGRVVPAGGCPVEEHRSSLKHEDSPTELKHHVFKYSSKIQNEKSQIEYRQSVKTITTSAPNNSLINVTSYLTNQDMLIFKEVVVFKTIIEVNHIRLAISQGKFMFDVIETVNKELGCF